MLIRLPLEAFCLIVALGVMILELFVATSTSMVIDLPKYTEGWEWYVLASS